MSRWALSVLLVACGETDPREDVPSEPIDLTRASTLRPRTSGPGRFAIRSPDVPGQRLAVTVDAADTFTLASSEDEVRAFVAGLDGLTALAACPADFGDLGTLDSLCAVVEPGAAITVDLTATPEAIGDLVAWSELDRFDAGCVPTAAAETVRCTITAEIALSPLATFETPSDPPPPPVSGACEPVARAFGPVGVLEPWGDRLLIGGGGLEGVGQSYPGLVRFGTDATVEACVPGPGGLDDEVRSVVADRQGRLYVGGNFDSYQGDIACTNLARIGADGTLDRDFCLALPEPPGAALLVLDEPILYVIGRGDVVAVDIETDTVVATAPPMSIGGFNTPLDVALVDDTLYLAGSVSQVGDEAYEGLAALDATTLEPVPVPLSFEFDPHTIEVVGDRLWLGGGFTTVNGQTRLRVAVVDEQTLTLAPVTVDVTGLNARVDDLAVSADGVWIAGLFDQVAGEDRESLALVDGEGAVLDETYPLDYVGPDSFRRLIIEHVIEEDGVVTVLGDFNRVGDVLQHHLASFRRSDGALLDTPGVVTDFEAVARLFPTDSARWVWAPGGVDFVSSESGLVIYEPATRTAEPLELQADDQINAAWLDGDVAYLWGFFDNLLGEPRNRFAAVDLATGQLVPWSVDLGRLATVQHVAFGPDRIYVSGDFLELDGTSPSFVRVLDKATGATVPGIEPSISGWVLEVVPFGDDLILCGDPETVNGVPRSGLAWISAIDGSLRDLTAPLEAPCNHVALSGDTLYVNAITSSAVSGLPADDRLFAVNALTGAVDDWQPGFSGGSIFGLDVAGDAVLAAGLQFPFLGSPTVVAFDATSAERLDWDLDFRGSGVDVRSFGDQIVFSTSDGEIRIVEPPN